MAGDAARTACGEVPLLPVAPPPTIEAAVATAPTAGTTKVRSAVPRWLVLLVLLAGGLVVGSMCPWGACVAAAAEEAKGDDDDDDDGARDFWPFPTTAEDDDDALEREDGFEALNHELMQLTPEESQRRFGTRKPRLPTPPRQSKIDHFVVLFMENHAADNFFGCMDLPGFDGSKGHSLPRDPSKPWKGNFSISCGDAPYVCSGGPAYDTYAGKFGKDGSPHSYPYSAQSDRNSALHGASEGGTATRMYSPKQVPIKRAIARHFGVFNKLYCAVPSASSPNHLFTQSGTSCGMQGNALYNDCGGERVSFPQRTIYDAMREHNVSFGMFLNSTCGLDGKPCHGEHPITPDSPSAISTPDVAMEGVARYKERFFSQALFYRWAAEGALPALSWLHPPLQACDHPCHDVAKGERLLKDVYEALRAGKKWKSTMLFVAYDDAGGYYDHKVPPFEGVPADESPCNVPGGRKPACGEPFDFRRLGLRTTAMLISPWVAKGAVFQEPKRGPTPTSQFELTSVAATVKNLFNLSSFLTKRDAWAGSFDELLLDAPRDDCPRTLPEAPPAATPWDPPPGTPADARGLRRAAVDAAGAVVPPVAQHCSTWHGGAEEACAGATVPNLKQRRNARLLAGLLGKPPPDAEAMDHHQLELWLQESWREFMARK